MTNHDTIADPLVSSSNVNGTRVFSHAGEDLGHIDHLMIDKKSGKVAYAVMHFGGVLGMGEETHPVPWNKLDYDTQRDGFVTDITKAQVEGAPARSSDWQRDRRWEEQTFTHWGVPPYWV